MNKLPLISFTRTVSAGQPIKGAFRVERYCTESARGLCIPIQKVETYQEYIAGCTEHDNSCLGHFCKTPRGSILLPQKLALSLGVMSNDYAKMAEALFNRDTASQEAQYREKLRSLMLGKSGKMRGDMPSGPVDCSAREVITTCWQLEVMSQNSKNDTLYFAVPRMVASNMKVLRVATDKETGLPLGTYVEDCLREDDWIIVVRPPSLWAGNLQPMKVVLWDHHCFGLAPSLAEDFHADHDGDEMQIYFIGTKAAINECERWKRLTPNKFTNAMSTMKLPANIHEGDADIIGRFMVHSTLSVRELKDGKRMPEIAKLARMKEPMTNMLVERLNDPMKVYMAYPSESTRGIKDVMAQQLNQGIIGDISRQARLSASCVQYKGRGLFHIKTGSETIKSVYTELFDIAYDARFPLGGNSCMRAVSALCSKAQQAALDSHRVSQSVSSKLDLVNNLIVGGSESLVAFLPGSLPKHSWKYVNKDMGNITFCIVDNTQVKVSASRVVAAYHPTVLKTVKLVGGDIREVCKNGIVVVCNYYDIKLSKLELYSLTELLCYRPEVTNEPITTKSGMRKRNMRWLAVVFANHYGKLSELQYQGITKRPLRPEVITDAAAFCNFDYVV